MANENKVHKCLLCGSTNYEVDSDGIATCAYCGRRFVVQDDCVKYKILPELNGGQFLRSAWIYLARGDAPLEVFDCDFEGVGAIEYQVVMDRVDARVPYSVTVGFDRQEPYLDTEIYYEQEPYTEYVRTYDYATKTYYNKQVTRYRKVKKERQVTRYRTVTDWSQLASEHSTESLVYVENGSGIFSDMFDEFAASGDSNESGLNSIEGGGTMSGKSVIHFDPDAFIGSFGKLDGNLLVAPDEDECNRMQITTAAESEVDREHDAEIGKSVDRSIRADHIRGLDYSINIEESNTWLLLVPEYYSKLSYAGKDYTVKAFPFGTSAVHGDKISNEEGLEAFKSKRNDEFSASKSALTDSYDDQKWRKNRGLLILATVLLVLSIAASIVVSIFISSVAIGLTIVLVLFVAAVVAFIPSRVVVKKNERRLDAERDNTIDKERRQADAEISSYTTDYKRNQLKLLNEKLEKLGVDAATLGEIS